MKVTVFMGVIGSGKDYQSQLAVDDGAEHLAFADGVRDDVWAILGWKPLNDTEYVAFKKLVFTNVDGSTFTGRDILQRYGTDVRRHEYSDVWCKRLVDSMQDLEKDSRVVISDCRFTNEVEYLKSLKYMDIEVEFVFCNYISDRYDDTDPHESERLAQHLLHEYGFVDFDATFNDWIHSTDMTKFDFLYDN